MITNLFCAIPLVGEPITDWLWGGFAVGDPTLNRFFSLHYLLPFIIAAVVVLHIWALHVPGNNNPTGVAVKGQAGHGALPPLLHDEGRLRDRRVPDPVRGVRVLRAGLSGPCRQLHPANPPVTPAHIVPEWYFLPFYAILRAIPNKLLGVVAMFGSILILFALPWLDTSRVRSGTYRPIFKQFFWVFVIVCIGLGYLGSKPAEGIYVFWARILTAYYFIHFIVILPLLGLLESPKPLPPSISDSVLAKKKPLAPAE